MFRDFFFSFFFFSFPFSPLPFQKTPHPPFLNGENRRKMSALGRDTDFPSTTFPSSFPFSLFFFPPFYSSLCPSFLELIGVKHRIKNHHSCVSPCYSSTLFFFLFSPSPFFLGGRMGDALPPKPPVCHFFFSFSFSSLLLPTPLF